MMDGNDNATSNSLVDECPPPPFYFELFGSNSVIIDPPPLPSKDVDVQASIYGGVLRSINPRYPAFHGTKDYKFELNRSLNIIHEKSLKLISYDGSRRVEENAADLKESLANIYKILEEYRSHEAREVLRHDLALKLEELQKVESSLKEALEYATEIYENS
eukprot:gene9257-12472_t